MSIEIKVSEKGDSLILFYEGKEIGSLDPDYEDDFQELINSTDSVYSELYELRESLQLLQKELGALRMFKSNILKVINSTYGKSNAKISETPKERKD